MAQRPFALILEEVSWLPSDLNSVAMIARIRKAPPLALSTVIGDVVHNLRAALDLMACDLVRLNGGNVKGVYFPFANSAEEFPGQIKAKNLDRAGEDVVSLITRLLPVQERKPRASRDP